MNDFAAKRIKKQYTHRISASASEVFPLLCPTREYDWIQDWSCRMVYSESGFAENGCIFRTSFPRGDEIWTVSRYEPENFVIQFVVVNTESHVIKMDIALEENDDTTTNIRWSHTFTSLTENGHMLLDRLGDREYTHMIRNLSEALDHYCTTDRMLERSILGRLHAALHKA